MNRLKKLKEHLKKKSFAIQDDRVLSILNEKTKEEPIVVRKALAIKKLLEEVPVAILDGELIIGLRPQMSLPEYATEEEKEWAWNVAHLTPYMSYGHNCPNYSTVLEKGLRGICKEAKNKMETARFSSDKDTERVSFWKAVTICCDSVINYAQRYAGEARKLAEKEENPIRKTELLNIVKICEQVPANPAQTFYEALQSVWLIYSSLRIVGHTLIQLGRVDQYLYPFYEHDIKEGKMTKEEARELLRCFWIKFNMTDFSIKEEKTPVSQGQTYSTEASSTKVYMGTGAGEEYGLQETGNNLIVGGVTPEGVDATNDLTYLCLEIAGELKLRDPIISVRVHRNSPKKLLEKAFEVLKQGFGMPPFYNDEVIIPALQKVGISLQDARNYCNDGCIEVFVPGKSEDRTIAIWIEALKCLELALNNGMSYRRGITTQHLLTLRDGYGTFLDDGDVQGLATGDATKFKSFEELMEAFKKQLSFAIERHARIANTTDMYFSKIAPSPLFSALVEGCIEKGKDLTNGGPLYNNTGTTLRGIPNTGEALAAIKKLVFEEKKITMKELIEALKLNFKSKKNLRELLIKAPKWGNNDDYVDNIVKEICDFWCKEISKYTNPRGGRFKAGLWATAADHAGQVIGASADGRMAGEAIATNLSAIKSRRGITSLLHSLAKVDYSSCTNSTIADIHLMPTSLDDKEKIEKIVALVKVYFESGGYALAFNVVRRETLIDAKEHPEKYEDLLVRTHGYSARFITLSREYQDLIIARAEATY